MTTSIMSIQEQLLRDEGFRSSVYPDPGGFYTIGIGTCVDARQHCGITQDEATLLMNNRLSIIDASLRALLPWVTKLDTVRYGVLQNMAYDLGVEGLVGFHRMLTYLEDGDYNNAAVQMRSSKWYGEVTARAQRLVLQMTSGTWQ